MDTFVSANHAEEKGAHRIELCSNLETGGLFPGKHLLLQSIQSLAIPVSVMIRPRPGDFEYSASELSEMLDQIAICKDAGIYGVVFGASKDDKLDYRILEKLIHAAGSLSITIHKVVDAVGDPVDHINTLRSIGGIDRVLSSGGKPTAWEGRFVLKEMMERADSHFTIMPGGGITHENIEAMDKFIHAREYHGRKIV